mmetsp:Transcript_56460/g.93306  ORF Transcript_56460/g.93306 Transcript_56460/m.93306 type:complete len:267 (+) Transcript_56460:46-846(+)
MSYRTKRDAEEAAEAATQETKRVKSAMNTIADEYVCPISQELPLDPVMAEDGKIYERADITTWLASNRRSPITNEQIGDRLLPATQVRNMIEQLVRSGAIEGDEAVRWKQKLQDEKQLKELRAKAEADDGDAIHDIGIAYSFGLFGLAISMPEARSWFLRGANNNPRCMARAGEFLLKGLGGAAKTAHGLLLTSRAADDIDRAAYCLGLAYMRGLWGLDKDLEQAKYWLQKTASGSCRISISSQLREKAIQAIKLLEEVTSPSQGR